MLAAFNRFCNSRFAPRGSNRPTMPKSLNEASNLLNATSIDQVAGGVAFRWPIRTKESECRAGERRWLERGAKRTLVRERRLKVSLAARAARSVRTAQMKKARSSERAYKKKNRHGFPCLQLITWRRRGDSESRCARFTSSAKASSRFAENSPPGCFPGANRPHRFESPCCCHKTKQARLPVPVAYNLAEEGGFEPP